MYYYNECSAPLLARVVDQVLTKRIKQIVLFKVYSKSEMHILKCWTIAFYNVYLHHFPTPTPLSLHPGKQLFFNP